MPDLLYKCMTKATTADGDQMKYSVNWAVARRGLLKVYEDRMECGDWTILHDEVESATLLSIRSYFFFPGYVLRIATEGRVYHFGLNGGKFWKSDLPFPVSREKGDMGYSKASILARMVLLGALGYWLWGRFG